MATKEKVFVDGMIVKKPADKAPDFVICGLSFKTQEMIQFLTENDNNGWVNAQIKSGKSGKYYAELDTWKRDSEDDQDIPF